ncbi:hypothetical protein [Streptomyces sp. CB01881]|uniref:hypothetical protein n=1 Tax=Streptomyces sp. CB01881 TaxID=2078691 RepID=UPI000CDBF08D|nr:hypothetical protein [Streptomyces sp. CB01881]AUY51043.1 hypothetical protein C2142_21235 [Streptomyces sp. CB01881]TYC74427.1 hypothetical protein EH183_21205 [Streptomyces sp. CB01881]
MTKLMPSSTAKLRRGTQELLERRGMAMNPGPMPPRLRTNAPPAGGAAAGGVTFRHGGRDADVAAMHSAPAMHAELKGHRHRGAEKHSAH